MQSFFKKLQKNIEENPELVVLRSKSCHEGITYRQLDEMSGRVCRYLKNKGIGKEDFVMVLMPREVSAYIAVIGAWKNGTAITLSEEDYSPERVEYIKKDLNCKLVISRDIFDEMMKCDVCSEYELPLPHDACYATYTSGSTGYPKGTVHEFGKLDMLDYDYGNERFPVEKGSGFAIITSLNFSPSIRNAVASLIDKKCIFVVEKSVVKNRNQLIDFMTENRIAETSATASLIKSYRLKTDYLKNVFVHSEPCSGMCYDDINLINLYTLSEIGFPLSTFRIDRSYDKAPLGFPNKNVDIRVVDVHGNKQGANEIGEIITEAPYTRGYVNLPDKTAEAFRNGFFYTGDLGYFDENGMLYLCGRKDEMIKINGNRIEPAEIELNVRKALNVDNAVAKGFSDGGRSFVAVYFLKKELEEKGLLDKYHKLIFSSADMRKKLEAFLPSYMIPSYYIPLIEFPENANGKLSRKDLPEPKAEDFTSENEFPQNEKEAYFCCLFEKVLGLKNVGATDDFYEIGGDSLSTILAVSQCEDYILSAEDIYYLRTARKLAEKYDEYISKETLNIQNCNALSAPQPLLPEQKVTFGNQLHYPDYVANNLIRFFKLHEGTDVGKFRTSVDKVLKSHPVFLTIIKNDNGVFKMHYCPDLFEETEIAEINADELKMLQNEQRRPFQMEDALLYRRKIYKCENELYFYLEIHHVITDGISLNNLFSEISDSYFNEDFVVPSDYFYLAAEKSAEKHRTKNMTSREILELYGLSEYMNADENSIRLDKPFTHFLPEKYEGTLKTEKSEISESDVFKEYNGNVFFLTAFLKAIAKYNKSEKALSLWVYNGRDNTVKKNSHGMIIRTLPAECCFTDKNDRECLEYVKDSVTRNIMQSDVEFIEGANDGEFTFSPYFIYQKDVLNSSDAKVFEKSMSTRSEGAIFELHLIDNSDENFFRFIVKYIGSCYNRESIESFCDLFESAVNEMLKQGKEE